jgi:hypothetical protein
VIGFLRCIGVLNAGVWFGGAVVFSFFAVPALFSEETRTVLELNHNSAYFPGALAQILIARYFKLQIACAIIAILHLSAENLYFGRAPQKVWFGLLTAIFAISLIGGVWLQPRLKKLHAIKYSTIETIEQRRAAAETFKTWHGISQLMNLFILAGVGVHLCRVAARGEDARFLDAGKLRS